MARARNIKPGFFKNEELVELPFETRLLFIGLWTLADREGRLEDRPKRIKIELFPVDAVDVDACLNQLQAHDFIRRYQHQECRYIQVLAFNKHQNPHKTERESTIPAPDDNGSTTVNAPLENPVNRAESLFTDSPNHESLSGAGDEPPPTPTKPKPKRATQVPEDFTLSDTLIAWGTDPKQGYTIEQMQSQVPRFVDYYRAKGEPRKDWDASFRTWMRNAKDYGHLNRSGLTVHTNDPDAPIVPGPRGYTPDQLRRLAEQERRRETA